MNKTQNPLIAFLVGLIILLIPAVIFFASNESSELEDLRFEVEECRAEAKAWYDSSTALADAIAIEAMRGGLASEVDTEVATYFAIQGHSLRCIERRFPPG
jgi:hypothetical protein